eukprot:scaffold14223_cov25-Prasinocladus_malaysianus.AAC.1
MGYDFVKSAYVPVARKEFCSYDCTSSEPKSHSTARLHRKDQGQFRFEWNKSSHIAVVAGARLKQAEQAEFAARDGS